MSVQNPIRTMCFNFQTHGCIEETTCCEQNQFNFYEQARDGENSIGMEINDEITASLHWSIGRPVPRRELVAITLQAYLRDVCPTHSSETLTR